MNAKQESRLNMYRALIGCTDQYKTITSAVPALDKSLTAFKTTVAAITSSAQQSLKNTAGVTINKTQNKQNLCSFTVSIAGAVYAWAADDKNALVKESAKTSFSALIRKRDDELPLVCRNYYDLAVANKAQLADYGITDAQLTAFQNAIHDYANAVPAPRNALAQKAAYRLSMAQLFKTADALLKDRIDKLVPALQNGAQNFKSEYKTNRTIVNPAHTATQLKISVTDGSTKEPLSAVTIQLQVQGITAQTGKTGSILLKPFQPGVYEIKISKPGYKELLQTVQVKMGQINTLQVFLTPQ